MMDRKSIASRSGGLLAVLFLAAGAPSPAWAHKVILNAWIEGNLLVTETGFGDGTFARGAKIIATDAATGEIVLDGTADDDGLFEARLPPEARDRGNDLRVVADAGAGHRAEVRIAAAEWAEAPPETGAVGGISEGVPEALPGAAPGIDPEILRSIVREEVRAQLRPILREVRALGRKGPGVAEILGGFGYIFGLAGLYAWLRRPSGKAGGAGKPGAAVNDGEGRS